MIVKVQRSVFTTECAGQVLIYNKDRSVMFQGEISKDIETFMGDSHKMFMYAVVDDTTIKLTGEAPWQDW